MSGVPLYGLVAEFSTAEQLLTAVIRVRSLEARHATLEAYSPFPIEGLHEAVGAVRDHIALFMLIGAIVGGLGTFALEWYSSVYDYPLNFGGRPLTVGLRSLPPRSR